MNRSELDSYLRVCSKNGISKLPSGRGNFRLWNFVETGEYAQMLKVQLFEQACNVNPLDADVQIALAVVHHIGHNYEAAIRRFKQAAELRSPLFFRRLGRQARGRTRTYPFMTR